jgi:hypothetical protein
LGAACALLALLAGRALAQAPASPNPPATTGLLVTPAAPAEAISPQTPDVLAIAPSIDPPDDASARSAFAYVRAAIEHSVRALRAGDDATPQAADLAPPDGLYPGACVTIRESTGRLLGRGVFVGGVRSVEFATQRALEQALQALPQARDVLQRAVAADALASSLVTLELSGQPTPLMPQRFSELDSELDMGIDGVLAIAPARESQQSHAVFPLGMLVAGMPPSRAMVSAVSVASGNPSLAIAGVRTHEAQAVQEKGVRLYRLRVKQLAQLSSVPAAQGAPPRAVEPAILTRGSRVPRASELSTPALRDLLARTTDHLVRRATTGEAMGQDVALWDDLRPLEGVQQGFSEGPSKAVATLALLHASQTLLATPGLEARQRDIALRAARLSERLLVQQLAGDDLFGPASIDGDPALSGAWLVALLLGARHEQVGASLRAQPWFAERVEQLGESTARALLRDNAGFVTGFADNVPEAARGVVACALAELAFAKADRNDSERAQQASGQAAQTASQAAPDAALQLARDALAQTYLGAGPGDLAGQLPWLWWAQQRLATGAPALPPALPPALLELREHIWQNQVREGDAPDLIGGIVLREQLAPSGKALPTWQGLRPLAFVASSVRDPRLTPEGERMPQLAKLLTSLRFARQLVVDESVAWAGGLEASGLASDQQGGTQQAGTQQVGTQQVGTQQVGDEQPRPTMLWGVRAAPWDYRMPTDACSAGVLVLSEAVRTLNSLAGQPVPTP